MHWICVSDAVRIQLVDDFDYDDIDPIVYLTNNSRG